MKYIKKLLILATLPVFAVYIASAQTGTTESNSSLIDSGLTPSNSFYFLDKFSEQLELFLTFNRNEKAKLRVVFAKERLAEIKEMLSSNSIELGDIASAKEDAKKNLAEVNGFIDEEKKKGVDVKDLRKEISDDYDVAKNQLESYYEIEIKKSEVEKEKLSKDLESKNLTVEQKNELKKQIKDLENKKSVIEGIKHDAELNKEESELEDDESDDADELEDEDKEDSDEDDEDSDEDEDRSDDTKEDSEDEEN